MYLLFDYIKKGKNNSRGETMIEVITSLALFAITMVTVATLFSASNGIFVKNHAIEKRINDQINDLEKENTLYLDIKKDTVEFEYTKLGDITDIPSNRIKKKVELLTFSIDVEGNGSALAKYRVTK